MYIHSYLPIDVLEWVNQTLVHNNLCVPDKWSNDLQQIYILLVAQIKAQNICGNRNPTLTLLPKPVGVYNGTPASNISMISSLDDLDLSDIQDEEWVEVKGYCENEITKEEIYT